MARHRDGVGRRRAPRLVGGMGAAALCVVMPLGPAYAAPSDPTPSEPVGVTDESGSLYAYPSGAVDDPESCPQATSLDEACTLQQALDLAEDGDVVLLAADPDDAASTTFATTTGWAVPHETLTIRAESGVVPTLDGAGEAPFLLDFTGSGTLHVDRLRIQGSAGSANEASVGGGIVVHAGALDAQRSTFADNDTDDGGIGGGIVAWDAAASLRVSDSTFVGNDAPGHGVGVTDAQAANGPVPGGRGAITTLAGADVSVTTSTFVDNDGAIVPGGPGLLSVVSSSFVGNDGAIVGEAGDIRVAGSLFADNGGHSCSLVETSAADVDAGYNIDSDGACVGGGPGSVSAAPHLAGLLNDLADNGGPTNTVALKPASPAAGMVPVDAAVSIHGDDIELCPATDQRGVTGGAGGSCHAGAVQAIVGVPLSVDAPSVPAGMAGVAYSTELSAQGGTAPYSWSLVGGDLPEGLTLGEDGVLAGTPTDYGSFEVDVAVVDANGVTASASLTLTIEPVIAPAAAPGPATIAVYGGDGQTTEVGDDFDAPMTAIVTDADGNAVAEGTVVTFAVASGDAAYGGLSEASAVTDADGIAAAPILTPGEQPGEVSVVASASGVPESAVFNATVHDQAGPEFASVQTIELPGARVGKAYKHAMKANGADDYDWQLVGGRLPKGLSLSSDGVISGTPTKAKPETFTVAVNGQGTATFTLKVQPAVPASASASPAIGTDAFTAATAEPTYWTPPGIDRDDMAMTGVRGVLPAGLAGIAMILLGGLAVVLASGRRANS